MSQYVLILFIAQFIILAVIATIEGNLGLMLYGIGGAILNYGVMRGI